MAKKIYKGRCLFCENEFEGKDPRKKFCNSSCAAKHNNKKRKHKVSSKKKISKSLKKHNKENPRFSKPKEVFFWNGVKTSKKKFNNNPQNIYEVSSRTKIKILERLNVSCFKCGWNEDICDIHHINGRKIPDCHNHKNLTILCPNCHRLAGNKRISLENILTIEEKIGDEWKKHYYG